MPLEGTLAHPLAVAVAPDGRVLVVGSETTRLHGRVFSPGWQPLGGDVAISAVTPDNAPIHCATAAWTTAGWVVAWVKNTAPHLHRQDVAARRLSP